MKKVVIKQKVADLFLSKGNHCSAKISLHDAFEVQCQWHCICEVPHHHSIHKLCAACGASRPPRIFFLVEDVKHAIHFESMEEAIMHAELIVEESPLGEVTKELVYMWIEVHEIS